MLLAMQNTNTRILCYYDARIGESCFGGMFNPLNYRPLPLYYVFRAYGELYALGTQTLCSMEGSGIFALAAAGAGGERAVMLTNTGADTTVTLAGDAAALKTAYLVDETHALTPVPVGGGRLILPKNQTVLLK